MDSRLNQHAILFLEKLMMMGVFRGNPELTDAPNPKYDVGEYVKPETVELLARLLNGEDLRPDKNNRRLLRHLLEDLEFPGMLQCGGKVMEKDEKSKELAHPIPSASRPRARRL